MFFFDLIIKYINLCFYIYNIIGLYMINTFNNASIKELIGKIQDPDFGKSFDELGASITVEVKAENASVLLKVPGPISVIAPKIKQICKLAFEGAHPDKTITVEVEDDFVEDPNKSVLKGVKHIIAVASGKGGVGKSSIAANVATAFALSGAKTGILDGDVYGPSQPIMFGLTGETLDAIEGDDGKTYALPAERHGVKVASMGFVLNRNEAAIVRGPMLAGYFSMLFEQIMWGELDVLVFDLPPGTGDIQLTLTQRIPLDGAVIVTTPQEIALSDVRRSISMFKKVNVDVLGVVENMSYFVPPDMLDKKYYIFGKEGGKAIALESGVPLLAEVPLDPETRSGNDSGEPVVLKPGYQSEIIKDMVANIASELRRKKYEKRNQSIDISL